MVSRNSIYLTFFIAFLTCFVCLQSAKAVSFNLSVGAANIYYKDNHEGDPPSNFSLKRYTVNTEGEMKVPFGTRLLQLSAGFQYQAPTLFTTSTQELEFWSYNTRLIFKLPSKPFNVDLIAEYGQETPQPSDTSFAYSALSGVRYLVSLSAFIPSYKFMIDLTYPVQNFSTSITHYQANIKYFFTMKQGDGGDDIDSGTFVKIGYDYREYIDTTSESYRIIQLLRTMTLNFGAYF